MTDQELKKLRRSDLLELLIAQGKENEQLRARLAQAEAQLAERKVLLTKAGSIAEASLQLNGVFEAAQAAARAAAENLDEYERILKELRDLNDLIPGEEMSGKISRLEDLAGKIFKIAKEQPKKLGSMRKFMDYYLPTSLKLLHRYAELDAQGVEGTNISDSKRKIEDTMDMMVTAFEKQLDKMFLSESIDISADIAAMQNLMRADGLVENEFLEEIQSVGKRN